MKNFKIFINEVESRGDKIAVERVVKKLIPNFDEFIEKSKKNIHKELYDFFIKQNVEFRSEFTDETDLKKAIEAGRAEANIKFSFLYDTAYGSGFGYKIITSFPYLQIGGNDMRTAAKMVNAIYSKVESKEKLNVSSYDDTYQGAWGFFVTTSVELPFNEAEMLVLIGKKSFDSIPTHSTSLKQAFDFIDNEMIVGRK